MRLAGLVLAVLGWFIAVLSTQVPGVGAQTAVALAGFLIAVVGVVGVLNQHHLKGAIWKSQRKFGGVEC
jgi:VIT1/CCC1 family predicted Fe2+/Mn2+ transporter